jgi:hypothetical protein
MLERDVRKDVQGKVGGEALQKVDEERETGCVEDRGSGSRSDGTMSVMGMGPGGIVKTKEWQVVGE